MPDTIDIYNEYGQDVTHVPLYKYKDDIHVVQYEVDTQVTHVNEQLKHVFEWL